MSSPNSPRRRRTTSAKDKPKLAAKLETAFCSLIPSSSQYFPVLVAESPRDRFHVATCARVCKRSCAERQDLTRAASSSDIPIVETGQRMDRASGRSGGGSGGRPGSQSELPGHNVCPCSLSRELLGRLQRCENRSLSPPIRWIMWPFTRASKLSGAA